jgi:hypothetical protein
MEQDLPMEFIMPTIKLYPPANIAIGRGYSFGRTTIRLINPDKIFSGKIQVQVLEKSEKDDLPLGNYWMHKKDLKNGQAL